MELLKKIFRRKKLFDNEEIKEGFKKELLEKPKKRISSYKEEERKMLKEIKTLVNQPFKLDNTNKTKRIKKPRSSFTSIIN